VITPPATKPNTPPKKQSVAQKDDPLGLPSTPLKAPIAPVKEGNEVKIEASPTIKLKTPKDINKKILPDTKLKTVKINAEFIKEQEKDDSVGNVKKREKVKTAVFIMLAMILVIATVGILIIFR
jgi:hypothetical protein